MRKDLDWLDFLPWIIVAATLVCSVGFFIFSAKMESETYNRLTGAHTTTWDALWVELRVQERPLP